MALLLSSRCALVGQKAAPQCPSAPAPPAKRCKRLPSTCPLGPARKHSSPLRTSIVRATNNNSSELTPAFDLVNYFECKVHNVELNKAGTDRPDGHIINLRILDRPGYVLSVHVGSFEISSLQSKLLNMSSSGRPLTHDLYKDTLDRMGCRVTRVLAVTDVINQVYLARLHLSRAGRNGEAEEFEIDARPSDAINLAVRFNAPMYVRKDTAEKMAVPMKALEPESAAAIRSSCKQEIMRFNDPTFEYKLKMAVAIANENFADAARLRDKVEQLLASDRALALVVAMESALEDDRLEEAAQLRNSLRQVMRMRPAKV